MLLLPLNLLLLGEALGLFEVSRKNPVKTPVRFILCLNSNIMTAFDVFNTNRVVTRNMGFEHSHVLQAWGLTSL